MVVEQADKRQKLEEEYIKAQLHVGGHFEIPRRVETFGEDGRPESTDEPMHFEVLQVQHGQSRVHTVDTVEAADDVSLTAHLAIEIQPETRWQAAPGAAAEIPSRVPVFAEGSPVWVSPLRLASFKQWSGRLSVFRDLEPGPEEGASRY